VCMWKVRKKRVSGMVGAVRYVMLKSRKKSESFSIFVVIEGKKKNTT